MKDELVRLYEDALSVYGEDDYRTMRWSSGESTAGWYDQMRKYADFARMEVFEVGCGFGSFIRLGYPYKRYVGIDIVPAFIEIAKERCKRLHDAEFWCGDWMEQELDLRSDLLIMSGPTADRVADLWHPTTIEKIFRKALIEARLVMVNFPSVWATCRDEMDEYYSPTMVLDIAMNVTTKVVLDHTLKKSGFLVVLERDDG